jgi:diguanylate cyclase (GGDEF)-like protein
MQWSIKLVRCLPLALAYFTAVALAVAFTRFDGGFAFLWGASAILIAALVRLPHRQWLFALTLCGIASMVATGVWGLGWVAAPYFALVNLTEGMAGAMVMRRRRSAGRALESLDWLFRFVIAVGIVAPVSAGLLVAAWMAVAGGPLLDDLLSFLISHGLGNLTFTPLALLVVDRRARQSTWKALRRRSRDAVLLVPLLVVTTLTVFLQGRLPLLFLPILPVMLIAFRTGREGAALSIALLAILGGGLSAAGSGPTQLVEGSLGYRLLFFQFYVATTVLTVLPVVADLQYRRALARRIRESEERYRLLAARLEQAAMTDPLTGIANRRAFRDAVEKEMQNRRKGQGCCIALFDIDHFKRVNDSHGHDTGDEVLKIFARVAGSVLRKDDTLARIGGEEFAVIFPDTSVEHALAICERLRKEIAGTPICVGDMIIQVTVSGGVAVLGPSGLDQALKQADRALYQAKDGGRDQLALAA